MLAPLALVALAAGAPPMASPAPLAPRATPSRGPSPQDTGPSKAVAREIALRALALELGRLATPPLRTEQPPTRARLLDLTAGALSLGTPAWVVEVTALDAAARSGALLRSGEPADQGPMRPEIWAATLRVLDPGGDGGALAAALASALAAPFHGVRLAGLERLTRALISNPELGPFLPELAAAPGLSLETCDELSSSLAMAGARSRDLTEAALSARTQARGGDASMALEELFDLWLARPISPEAIDFLRSRFPAGDAGHGLVEAMALVAEAQGSRSLRPGVVAALTALGGPLSLPLDDWDLDERTDQVARRSRSAVLGRAMLARSMSDGRSQRARLRCVRGAAWALPFDELLRDARALDEPAAIEVWRIIANRPGQLPSEEAETWLLDSRDEVREAAAREVGRRLTARGERPLLQLAIGLLDDPRAELRSLAFSWLCEVAAKPTTWLALRAAFDREGDVVASGWRLTERQGRWLAQLPRGVKVSAFRDLIMELVGRARQRGPAVVELLGPFSGDPEVGGLLRRVLQEELEGIEAAAAYPARLMSDARAAALASALAAVEGEAAVPVLVDGLYRSMWLMHGEDAREDARPQLPKVTCGLLERSAAGRAALAELVGDEVPVRVRLEAALQLSKSEDLAPGVARLVALRIRADYERVDGTLRARGLEALGRMGAPEITEISRFLERLSGPGGDPSEREMAIGAMGRRGLAAPLRRLSMEPLRGGVPDLMAVEAGVAAVRALADPALGERRTLDELLDLVDAADARLSEAGLPELEGEALGQLRGTALISAAKVAGQGPALAKGQLGSVGRRLAEALTRRPIDQGPADIASRFRGEELGAVRFRWSAEVAAVEARPELAGEFLNSGEGLDGVDGRLLLLMGELSRRKGTGGDQAERLLERGLFAMAGEPRTRAASRDLTFGRAALGRAILDGFGSDPGPGAGDAEDAVRWDRAALQATMLLMDWRQGRIGRAILEAEFGVADVTVQRDPEARLAALSRVFRGRASLARGEGKAIAEAWAEGARDWAKLDRQGGEALAALDMAISLRQR